ncbi:MAG: SH3 domain-containing protein [Desulfosarcina sp.]|nr:SH3 domain-containing protein [Desulfosarcina sp.]
MNKSIPIVLACLLVFAGADLVWAERLSVSTDIANIRSGPDTSDAVIWQVEKYHPLKVVKKQGSWCLFEDFEGDRGWIHNSLLADIKSVIVILDKCNVRSGPGTDNDIQFTVDSGVPFKVLETKGDWLQVIHADGDKGWIHRSLVW